MIIKVTVLKPNSGVIPRPKAEESQFQPASQLEEIEIPRRCAARNDTPKDF
jgi:hypothetical protein